MKSERRHELQRNALEAELLRVWEFLRRRGNLIAWVGLGVAVVVLGTVWYVKRVRADTELAQTQFERFVAPVGRNPPEDQRQASLEKVASDKSQTLWASDADVKLGDDFSQRLLVQWHSIGDSDRAALRAQAQAYYQRAISDFPKEPVTVAMAHFGLGKLAEDWNEVDTARKEYEEALSAGDALRGQPVAYVIQEALNRLPQFEGKVYMPASAPASGPAIGPSTRLGASPSTGIGASPSAGIGASPRTRESQPVVGAATRPIGPSAPAVLAPASAPGSSPAKSD